MLAGYLVARTINTGIHIGLFYDITHVVLSEVKNYIDIELIIKEIEEQILKILEAVSLPAETLMCYLVTQIWLEE